MLSKLFGQFGDVKFFNSRIPKYSLHLAEKIVISENTEDRIPPLPPPHTLARDTIEH